MIPTHRSLLFVDDNIDLRNLMAAYLGSRGYDVATASDGVAALELMGSRSFDFAVVDMIMPRKEGLETIMEMKSLDPGVHIVAISGGGFIGAEDLTRLGHIVGADERLTKPFKPSELAYLLERVTDLPRIVQ